MDFELLKQEVKYHEGVVLCVYTDSLGFETAGCGHLIKGDIEKSWDWSDPALVESVLEEDLYDALNGAEQCFADFHRHPDSVQRMLVGFVFNVGYGKARGFKRMRAALAAHDYAEAARELMDSRWSTQVGRRAEDYQRVLLNA